jgi:predicted aspartyl protease
VDDNNRGSVDTAAQGVMVTTVEAVLIKADGRRVDYGVIASSDPDRIPITPRWEDE